MSHLNKILPSIFAKMYVFILVFFVNQDIFAQKNDPALYRLKSLPYICYTEKDFDTNKIGVVTYNKDKVHDGYNLYESFLLDMYGQKIKEWEDRAFILILDNGDIIAKNDNDKVLGRYSWNNEVIWENKEIRPSHDIALSLDGNILSFTKEVVKYNGRKVEFGAIVECNQHGEEISRWSSWDNFKYLKQFHQENSLDQSKEVNVPMRDWHISYAKGITWLGDYDYYHFNSLQVLQETALGNRDKRFQKGNWLVSARFAQLVFILDKDTRKIVWSYALDKISGGIHMPRLLDNGNILFFENGDKNRKYSKAIEIDPVTKKIIWEYGPESSKGFYSPIMGSAQRLSNGNTLITDGINGYVFEITPDKEIVWEWYNPEKFNKSERYQDRSESKRKSLYRMMRIPKEKIDKIIYKNN